ncbi:MAG: MATE family efflux transporter [Lachnospiraceae bacterium]|nr:MATE family efflux transporter [Lachnospiraceae bacterium]
MNYDLTKGNIVGKLWKFSLPLMVGNLLQQLYNIVDTLIVGRVIGADALAAVGASYTLMVFVTSILLGLCMGCGVFFAIQYGRKDFERLNTGTFISFVLIGILTLVLNGILYLLLDNLIQILQIPLELQRMTRSYLWCIFMGITATYVYNFFANLLRAVGNSVVPLIFLGISAVLNIVLDILFVYSFQWGIQGAAIATVLSQYLSAIGITAYYYVNFPELRVKRAHCRWDGEIVKELANLSVLTSVQQSIMNFGILMVQGLVNSFGTVVMAAFAAAVKIDSLAYMPVQDFGNAFSTFVAQNHGAGEMGRIRKGMKQSVICVFLFCLVISTVVCVFARPLLGIFFQQSNEAMISVGVQYLRIEAVFYFGIGLLFLLYGFYRAVNRPGMSVVLTILSLGTRVLLAYTLAAIPQIGVTGIWISIPIGWFLADMVGVVRMRYLWKQDT